MLTKRVLNTEDKFAIKSINNPQEIIYEILQHYQSIIPSQNNYCYSGSEPGEKTIITWFSKFHEERDQASFR